MERVGGTAAGWWFAVALALVGIGLGGVQLSAVGIAFLLFAVVCVLLGLQSSRRHRERAPRAYLALNGTEVKQARIKRFTKKAALGIDLAPNPGIYGASLSDTNIQLESYPGTVPALAVSADQPQPIPELINQVRAKRPNEGPAWFARVLAENRPPDEAEALVADKTTAHVTIRTQDQSLVISSAVGRWASSAQEHERERAGLELEHSQKDIKPNDLPEPIDIAMKYPDDEDCYFWNDENSLAPDGRLELHRLTGKLFLVDVTLKASNTQRVSRSYVLRNLGKGGTLELDPSE